MLAICILIAIFIAVFWIPFGQFYGIFGSAMMVQGLGLIIFGGIIGVGGLYKAYPAWMRSHKRAVESEMKSYHKDRRKYASYGFYLALAGILALVIGLIAYFI